MKFINSVCRILGTAVIVVVILMMLLTVADVFMRYIFANPITGTTEITEFMMVGLPLAMAWAAVEGRHITVDAVMKLCPKRLQVAVDIFTLLMCLGIFIIITWQSFIAHFFAREFNVKSALLDIPDFPFYILLAVGYGLLCLSIMPLLIGRITEAFKR